MLHQRWYIVAMLGAVSLPPGPLLAFRDDKQLYDNIELFGASQDSRRITHSPHLNRGFGLDASIKATNPHELLGQLAPELANAALQEVAGVKASGRRLYHLLYQGVPLHAVYLLTHWRSGSIYYLQARLPEIPLQEGYVKNEFLPVEEVLAANGFDKALEAYKTLVPLSQSYEPAWAVTVRADETAALRKLLIHATNAELLSDETLVFHSGNGQVYERNPVESELVIRPLPELQPTGWLDGTYIKVYGHEVNQEPRAHAPDGQFIFSPDGEADFFDQTQAYYHTSQGVSYFQNQFAFPFESKNLIVLTNTAMLNNARYVPPTTASPGEIEIGTGDGSSFINLSRDGDVFLHELGHHIIFPYLNTSQGETGILHEGIADYFAYAITGDPYLAESIIPELPYLRSAILSPSDLYDDSPFTSAHMLGRYVSALLWQLRTEVGVAFDQTVYLSLDYMPPDAGITDALLALLQADYDLNPEAGSGKPLGKNYCRIITTALQIGFSNDLGKIDGRPCDYDLSNFAKDLEKVVENDKQTEVSIGKLSACGVISKGKNPTDVTGWLLLLPLLLVCKRGRIRA